MRHSPPPVEKAHPSLMTRRYLMTTLSIVWLKVKLVPLSPQRRRECKQQEWYGSMDPKKSKGPWLLRPQIQVSPSTLSVDKPHQCPSHSQSLNTTTHRSQKWCTDICGLMMTLGCPSRAPLSMIRSHSVNMAENGKCHLHKDNWLPPSLLQFSGPAKAS